MGAFCPAHADKSIPAEEDGGVAVFPLAIQFVYDGIVKLRFFDGGGLNRKTLLPNKRRPSFRKVSS
jgi:hypothetical protein